MNKCLVHCAIVVKLEHEVGEATNTELRVIDAGGIGSIGMVNVCDVLVFENFTCNQLGLLLRHQMELSPS